MTSQNPKVTNIFYFEQVKIKVCTLLALRMYPGCEKVDPKVTAKTTLECISYLIQSERDFSLFTKVLYSRYSIKYTQKVRFLMGQIGQVCFKRLGRTVMEETIGQWSQ